MRANEFANNSKISESLKNKLSQGEDEEEYDEEEEEEEEDDDDEKDILKNQKKTIEHIQNLIKETEFTSKPLIDKNKGIYQSNSIQNKLIIKSSINYTKENNASNNSEIKPDKKELKIQNENANEIYNKNNTKLVNINYINPKEIQTKIKINTETKIVSQNQIIGQSKTSFVKKLIKQKGNERCSGEKETEGGEKQEKYFLRNEINNNFNINKEINKKLEKIEKEKLIRKGEKEDEFDTKENKNNKQTFYKEIQNINIENIKNESKERRENEIMKEENKTNLFKSQRKYADEDEMKKNGIEIVQIPIEKHNLYMEKRDKSEEKKKKQKEKRARKKQKNPIINLDERNLVNKNISFEIKFIINMELLK